MRKPYAVGFLASLFAPLTIGCCLCRPNPPPQTGPPDKYAVLASTEVADTDDVKYNSEFWYDLVLTYCTLIENGFESDNIFVLYGDGSDGTSTYDAYTSPFCDGKVASITDISLMDGIDISKGNICNVLCCLSTGRPAKLPGGTCKCASSSNSGIGGFKCSDHGIPALGDEDFLFTWIKGHGSASICDTSLALKSGYTLQDKEIAGLFQNLQPDHWVALFETCDAGGWLDDFPTNGETAVVASSGDPALFSTCKETSWTATYPEMDATIGLTKVVHGRFSYWVNGALRPAHAGGALESSDADGNNLVSILEHFKTSETEIKSENSDFTAVPPVPDAIDLGGIQNPAINTKTGVTPCVFIRLPHPGADDDVFSMDHLKDDSIIPSVDPPTVPFDSPDLWVRHEDTGLEVPIHQEPKAGHDNHVYARAYNIGCADPGKLEVHFFYAPLDSCDVNTTWKAIGVDSVLGLPVTEKHVFHAKWNMGDVPGVGPYCLIAELHAVNDPPDGDASVASDNNKAQLKIAVIAP